MKKCVKSFLSLAVFLSLAAQLWAVDVQDTPEPGKWCGDLAACLSLAESRGIPLLVYWGNPGCGHCETTSNAFNTAEFRDWAATRKLVMCFGEGSKDQDIKAFAKSGSKSLSYYPFMCVYWAKDGGRTVRQNFSALRGMMPVNDEPTLAGCVIASVEKYIRGYEYVDPTQGAVSFAVVGQEMATAANGHLYASRTATLVQVAADEGGVPRLSGTLSVRLSAKNRITASYAGLSPRTLVFSGTWTTIDLMTGEVVALLTRGKYFLRLSLLPDGTLSGVLLDEDVEVVDEGSGRVALEASREFDGQYVVFLRTSNEEAAGIGALSLSLKNGRATVRGNLPDGTPLSVTATAVYDGSRMLVPVFKTQSKRTLCALIEICEDGTVCAIGVRPFVRAADGEVLDLDVAGGRIDSTLTPAAMCQVHGLGEDWELSADVSTLTGTGMGDALPFAPVALVPSSRIAAASQGTALVSLAYVRSSGVFSGKARLQFTSGKSVTATLGGALLPDGKSGVVGLGTLYFKDRRSGATVDLSVPVGIRAK